MIPWAERVPMLSIHPDAASREDVAQMAAELMEANQQILAMQTLLKKIDEATPCIWKPDETWEETSIWNTICGESFILDSTPTENEMRFCPYCGHVLKH